MTTSGLAPLAVAVPMVAAALCSIFGARVPRLVLCLFALVAAAFETYACAALAVAAARNGTVLHWFGGWQPRHGVSLGIDFAVDPAAAALATLVGVLTTAAFVFAWTFYEDDDGAFHALMLVFNAALVGFFFTGDLFTLFVFFELMSVSAYALTGYKSEDGSAVAGALSFGVVNSAGSLFTLVGIATIYARTGALNMAQIAHALHGADPLVVTAFALICIGFLVKAAVVPFHFWLSEAHAVAPTPLCVLFSGIMVEAGLYAVARTYWSVFSGTLGAHAGAVGTVLLTIGIATALVGAIMSFSQRHLKRLLAFSTISHSGAMLCAIALLRADALGGFLVYLVGHGLVKGSLFLASGIVLNRYRTVDVESLRGRLRGEPILAGVLGIGALALAGLPPSATSLGKAIFDRAADESGLSFLPPALLLAAALTGAAVLNALGRMTFGWGPAPDPAVVAPADEQLETSPPHGIRLAVMTVPTVVLLAAAFLAGLAPHAVAYAGAAARSFADLPAQENLVLAARAGAPLDPRAFASGPTGAGPGLTAAAIAVLFAAVALFAHRFPTWPRMKAVYTAAMKVPHAWHSGLVTDYVTWLAMGAACFVTALIVMLR